MIPSEDNIRKTSVFVLLMLRVYVYVYVYVYALVEKPAFKVWDPFSLVPH